MDINKFINLFSIIGGVTLLVLGGLVAMEMTRAEPDKAGLLFILGGIILILSLIQKKRHRY
ncbi:MAG: hypothetical protein PHS19_01100 [Eubacteriales bacterium]|nr:hypothetical protein [Eubacteriales bacterium]